jgi:integrase
VVYLPDTLAIKYPNAGRDWPWQYVFPSRNLAVARRSAVTRRHHVDQSVTKKATRQAVEKARITKKVSAHTFRHSIACHRLRVRKIGLNRAFPRERIAEIRQAPRWGNLHPNLSVVP